MTARAVVIVLTKDGGDHLLPGLEALQSEDVDLVLVDNGSADGAAAKAAQRFPGVKLLRSETNLGFTGGVALALASTAADVVVLVNDDAVVEKGAVAGLVDALLAAPKKVIAASGLLLDRGGHHVDFAGGLVTFDGHAFQRGQGLDLTKASIPKHGDEIPFPCGGFCALKRRDFDELGGFDGDYFAYLEDVDFGWRASLAGRSTIFVPEARARHLSGATGKKLGLETRGVLLESNAFFTAYKNLGDDSLAALLPAIFAAFQHRMHRGLLGSQLGAATALADPFAAPPPQKLKRQLKERLLGRHTAPGEPLLVDDAHARMWLVAWNRIVSAWPHLVKKRRAAQAWRTLTDRQLFARFPLHIVPTYPGDAELFASEWWKVLLPREPKLTPKSLAEPGSGEI